MKIRLLILVLILPFLLCACSKDGDKLIVNPEPTETQLVADALQKDIDAKHPTLARVYIFNAQDNSWVSNGGYSSFKVCEPFIQVGGTNYHLSYLVQYRVSADLDLYFKY